MRIVTRGIITAAVTIWCIVPEAVVAQQRALIDTPRGARVQLLLRDSLPQGPILPRQQMVVGTLIRAAVDSVWLRPYGATEFAVPRAAIRQASVSRGRSRVRSALAIGASWGFAFAAAVALDQLDEDHAHKGRDALIGAGVGVGAGALLGAARPYEHWRRVTP